MIQWHSNINTMKKLKINGIRKGAGIVNIENRIAELDVNGFMNDLFAPASLTDSEKAEFAPLIAARFAKTKNYTVEEKTDLWFALNELIRKEEIELITPSDDKDRMQFGDSIDMLKDLRIKLMLDIAPIEIRGNNCASKYPCPLCGRDDQRSGIPEWAFINNKPICHSCFIEHEPVEYQKICERNARFFDDLVEAEEPDNASWKDSLPF